MDLAKYFVQAVKRFPEASYVFVKQIPKSPVGKILRRKVQVGEYEIYDISVQQ